MKSDKDRLANEYPISVIIPCHNAAETLGDCLAALLENDLTNVELTIVDDGSTDETSALIAGFASSFDGRFRHVCLAEQRGPGAARNTGMRSAGHPYLFFVDADILLPGQAIQWIRETLDLYSHQRHVIGVLGTYSEQVPHSDFFTVFKNLHTCHLYRMTDTFSPFVHTPIFAVRKAVLEDDGPFDEEMIKGEDFKLGSVLGSKGYRFIIDWRIKGVHLKTYTLLGILREDWCRISQLRRIQLTAEQRRFSYRAHRWNRILSLTLPGITLFSLILGIFRTGFCWFAGLTLLFFLFLNLRFFLYTRSRQGILFAVLSVTFLFFEMLWAQAVLVLPKQR